MLCGLRAGRRSENNLDVMVVETIPVAKLRVYVASTNWMDDVWARGTIVGYFTNGTNPNVVGVVGNARRQQRLDLFRFVKYPPIAPSRPQISSNRSFCAILLISEMDGSLGGVLLWIALWYASRFARPALARTNPCGCAFCLLT